MSTELARILELKEQIVNLRQLNWALIYAAGGEIEVNKEILEGSQEECNMVETDTSQQDKVIWKAYKQKEESK